MSPRISARRVAAALAAVSIAVSAPGHAKPFMLAGLDEKIAVDADGKTSILPSGNDLLLIVDLADPEAPRIAASLKLENSLVGPPTNLAIAPDGSIALLADSMTVVEQNGARKMVPTDKLFVIDLTSNPPAMVDTLRVGRQPSGLSFRPDGTMALVCNRADGSIAVLKIDGKQVAQTGMVQVGAGVSHVTFTPDGKRALAVRSPDNKVAILTIDGGDVTYDKHDLPAYAFPYNVVVTPDGKLAITADNGFNGSSDGHMDAVSVIDLEGPHPHVIARLPVEDAPEGLAMSPRGDLAVVVNVNGSNFPRAWFHHKTGSVTVLKIDGKTVTPVKTIQVGAFPEPAAFSPDGRYIYIGNFLDKDFSILRVDGTEVVDTGKRFSVPGHPASARTGPN